MMHFLLLFTLCLALPIKEDNLDISNPPEFTNNTSENVIISSLLPPSTLSDCLASDYCNRGYCKQGIQHCIAWHY